MSGRFAFDFGDVRIHDDPQSSASAAMIGARAYTIGKHVVLPPAAHSSDGASITPTLAHELVHVVQQAKGSVNGRPIFGSQIKVSDPSDRFEREAADMACRVVAMPAASYPQASGTDTMDTAQEPLVVQRDAGLPGTPPTSAPTKAPTSQPTATAGPASESAPSLAAQEVQGTDIAKQLQPIFDRLFHSYGPKSQFAVPGVKAVPDSLGEAAATALNKEAEGQLRRLLKVAPEVIVDQLKRYYKIEGRSWPKAYGSRFSEDTPLTSSDRNWLLMFIKNANLMGFAREPVGGFYSPAAKTMVVKSSSMSVGTLIHEMAHACAHDQWNNILARMKALNKTNSGKLDEGIACLIGDLVATEWWKLKGGTIPFTGYEDDNTYRDTARQFKKAVGEPAAYRAYFGGFIKDDAKDSDLLYVGDPFRKWMWPW
jgi:hypothetical protein